MPCGDSRTVRIPLNQAAAQTRAALAGEGFAIEIDIQAVLAARPGEEAAAQTGDYLIRADCTPPLARRPVTADSSTRLLPPCNVAIRRGTRSSDSRAGLRIAPASSTADAPR